MATPNASNQSTKKQAANPQRTSQAGRDEQVEGGPAGANPRGQGGQADLAQGDRAQQVPTSRESGLSRRSQPAGGLTPFGILGSPLANPFAVLQQLQAEMDRMFGDFGLGRGLGSPLATPSRGLRTAGRTGHAGGDQGLWTPQLDVFRRGEEIVVRADLPGLSREDVSVDVEDGVLTIRGERRQEAKEDRDGYYWSERSYGTFERSIALPEGVDEAQAKASFRDGVLEVTLPAPTIQERRARRIDIR